MRKWVMDYSTHRLAYCEFLLSSQLNYTQTYFAEHHEDYSHDSINRFLRLEKLTPKVVWEKVKDDIIKSDEGYVLFDDVVLDKRHSRKSSLVRRQWSGNAKAVIHGIGVVTCVYVNAELNQFWILDYRIYDKAGDGQSKINHMLTMLDHVHYAKQLPYRTVLMDSWYATMKVMKHIEALGKFYYCPIKCNRKVDDSDGQRKHQQVQTLTWTKQQQQHGKQVHLKNMPKGHRVKLFRLVSSNRRTEYIVTNDLQLADTDQVQQHCAVRWHIEQFHRETKQTTGIEACQCRSPRALRNHIACAFLVWVHLKYLANQLKTTVYQLKQGLLDDYIKRQLKHPSYPMSMAA